MDAGSTFLLTQVDNHLWVVLSDPRRDPKNVLLVSLTTLTRLKESVCILAPGEHDWVRHQTCVSYEHAKVVPLDVLYKLKDKGLLVLQAPLSPALLQRVRSGAAVSMRITLDNRQILVNQGLIDP